jgi:hypothetical protein
MSFDIGPGGLPNPTESTMGRAGLPPHSPRCPLVTKGSPGGGGLVLGLHHGDSHILVGRLEGRSHKED